MQTTKGELKPWQRVINMFFENSYESGNSLYISVPEIDTFDKESKLLLPEHWEKQRGGDFTFEDFWYELKRSLPSDYQTEECFMVGFSLPISQYSDWTSLSMYRIDDRFLFHQEVPALTSFVSESYILNDMSSQLTTEFIFSHLFADDLKYMKPFSLDVNQNYIDLEEAKDIISEYGCYWPSMLIDLKSSDIETLEKRISEKEVELIKQTEEKEIEESDELKSQFESIRLRCLPKKD